LDLLGHGIFLSENDYTIITHEKIEYRSFKNTISIVVGFLNR